MKINNYHSFSLQPFIRFLAIGLFFLFSITGIAQAPTGLYWDIAVGCEDATDVGFNVEGPQECIKVCEGSTVTYTLTGDPTPWIDVQWYVVGGTIQNSSASDVTIAWGNGLYGEITVRVETNEEIFTRRVCVELIPKPIVDFTVYPNGPRPTVINVCKDEVVYFENLTTNDGNSQIIFHSWYFSDDDTTVETFEPSHIFTQNGVYYVILTVTNDCNCSSSEKIEVHVGDEGMQISCNSIACENEVETYTVTNLEGESVECFDYQWIADGGTIIYDTVNEVQVQWDRVDQDGFGYLTYNPFSCDVTCQEPVTIKVPVIKDDVLISGPTTLCEGAQARYAIPQWPSTEVEWQITPSAGIDIIPSDQPNEIVLEGITGGNYILEAIYTNTLKGCGGVAFKELTIENDIKILGNTTTCINESENFYTTTSGIQYDWIIDGPTGASSYSGSTINAIFTEPGLYTIYIGDIDCITPFTVYVKPPAESPIAIDGPLEVCFGMPIAYSAVPEPPGTHQAVWNIAPGSGVFSSTNTDEAIGDEVSVIWNPNYTGTYQLRLFFENEGCVSQDVIVINPTGLQIDYDFAGPQNVCSSSYASYTVDYLEGDKYEWKILTPDLGSIAENPQNHEVEVLWNNVATTTTALLELSIEKCGAKTIKQFPVVIEPSVPISINAPNTVCRDEVVNFSINGLTSWNTITWNFGDGGTATGPNTSHIYDNLSPIGTNYIVQVTVTEPNGCLNNAIATFSLQVQPAPLAHLTPALNHNYCSAGALATDPPTLNLILDSNYATAIAIEWFYNGSSISPALPPMTTSYTATQFGQYYAVVESANGCTDTTNIVYVREENCNIDDDCMVNELPPTINTPLANTGCNAYTATAVNNSGTTPLSYHWQVDGNQLTGQTATTANFTVSGVGIHRIYYSEVYATIDIYGNPCSDAVVAVEEFIVPYEANLDYSIICNTAGNGYNVTIYEASDYFPTTPIQSLTYFVDGVNVGSGTPQGLPQITVPNLTPGNHTLGLDISGSGYAACSTSLTITLPDFPTATIVAPLQACAGEPVPFAATVNDPNLIYEWDFDDGALNSLLNPIRNFSVGQKDVILTVTNALGCSTTVSHAITIDAPNMDGSLDLSPPSACAGNPITITYSPPLGQSSNVTTHIWKREVNGVIVSMQQTPVTVNNITVTQPGIYILDGVDNNGCVQYGISRISVAFLETPDAVINGPLEVCAETPFQLHANPVFENNYQYSWELDGQPLPQWDDIAVIDQTLITPGNYTYDLTVTTLAGCSATTSYDITVNPLPDAPEVSIAILECEPYTVELDARANEPGIYLWSDGQTGNIIQVTHGGPYRVTFINDQGCSSSKEIDVPQNPEAYIWAYPQGCYEVCEQNVSDYYVTGPIIPFTWEWQVDSNNINSGMGIMPNQFWSGDGLYQLQLDNGYCNTLSQGFSWELAERCQDCDIILRVLNLQPMIDGFGNCYYTLTLDISNHSSISYTINNLTNSGVMVPGGGYLPPGVTVANMEFYPPAGFAGGMVSFALTSTGPDQGITCLNDFSINFPACPTGSHRPTNGEETETGGAQKYTVAPNPTTGVVQLSHTAEAIQGTNAIVYIYDLYGREIKRERLNLNSASTPLDLSPFANGTYLLVLREETRTVFYQ
ncbi:PKD domain-containing protein [Aequorivita echinoideorum]|uniref:T9SS type A sorting domain-containing protein n=1 Tax=Aequorivita echinoideorum TaxID=1549647 RepID=A0ABS5S582_9FLAO|nr:PKD domain-containing protein [Aequorivita echinoideorum]MBT0608378.1 T9SS type A sorting domain-containing protein [Aequorivita echinoideorum]